jgi:hypothetical protein
VSTSRDLARMFLRQYPLQTPTRGGESAEDVLTRMLATQHMSGLRRGYDSAVEDFYHDETGNWDSTTPTLHRILGGFKRWYGR